MHMCIFKVTIIYEKSKKVISENIFLKDMDINGLLIGINELLLKSYVLYRKLLNLLRKKMMEMRDILFTLPLRI